MGARYTTREAVKTATDSATTAWNNTRVDGAIEAASRLIDQRLHRTFWPQTATRYFDWPQLVRSRSWILELGEHEIVSVSSVVAGGTTIPASGYLLYPNSGPPYTRIEVNLGGSAAWASGDTHQQAIAITGVWCGCPADTAPAGALAEALDASETLVDVTNSAAVGVGSILLVDGERIDVVEKSMLSTGQTGTLTAAVNAESLAVANGAAFNVGETLLLDSERVLVVDIAGNTLTVKRAFDGSTLAAHTDATIYAPRTLTVERGAFGTTAAAHLTAATLTKHKVPGPIGTLCRALAIDELQQDAAGWSRTSGSGESEREASGKAIARLWKEVRAAYARKARGGAV